ncbi:MAG: hypothetical protein RLQ12_06110 [Cyclobacteriaceae bacterium]
MFRRNDFNSPYEHKILRSAQNDVTVFESSSPGGCTLEAIDSKLQSNLSAINGLYEGSIGTVKEPQTHPKHTLVYHMVRHIGIMQFLKTVCELNGIGNDVQKHSHFDCSFLILKVTDWMGGG